ncbi:hypothetical protein FHS85_001739 [Rhodoligotrophos appendicifer]|uniref:hypothetical protein n=1 Tax=Rhodoligotrophos appendicifer TaxID=987056 RepID=UPI001185B8D8|nr:hypothetical protein [Rhodoligotrophos appendicifer]
MAWAWYKAGTVSVENGSDEVVGASGTLWAAKVRSGDAFLGPDGVFYEIESVNSDNNLTLNANYAGTTGSGESYSIAPLAPLSQILYDTLQAFIASLSGEFSPGALRINGAATEAALSLLGDVSLEADASGDQVTRISRNAASKQAMLILATALSDRARIGLVNDGTEDLHLAVSADGATWIPAITVRNADGTVVIHQSIEDRDGNPIGGGGSIKPGDIAGAADDTTMIIGKLASDDTTAMRELDLAALQTALGTVIGRNVTISTGDPSGGVDGDLWFKVA